MILKDGDNIFTIHEAPVGDDAFEYCVNYDEDCLVRFVRDIQTEMKKGPVYGHFC